MQTGIHTCDSNNSCQFEKTAVFHPTIQRPDVEYFLLNLRELCTFSVKYL